MKSYILSLGLIALSSTSLGVESTRMVYGENTKLQAFDPYTSHESAGHRLADLLFDSLVTTGPGGTYEPHLAKSWTIENDGSAIHVVLKEKVFWHKEGKEPLKPLNAADIATTLRLIKSPNSEIPNAERFQVLKRVEVLSNHRVRIHFHRALAQPLKFLMFKVLPNHKLESTKSLTRDHSFNRTPIGTGPFAFVKSTPQGEIQLKRNPFYFKELPSITEVIMKPFVDNSIMTQSLLYSSLDLVTYISPRDVKEVGGDRNLDLVPYDAQNFSFVAMNMNHPQLKDKRIRQAINYSIDRREMLDAFFQGKGHLITGPFAPTSWAYNLNVPGYRFNQDRARELLKQAGFEDRDNNGFVEDTKGQEIQLTFAVPLAGESEMTKRIVLAYQNYLQVIGIKVELKFLEWTVWKAKVLGEHDFDLTIASWDFDDSSNITSLFHSQSARAWGNNFVSFQNPRVDSMLAEASSTNDFDKRQAIYKKLHSIISEESPYTFLWTLKHHAGHQRKLLGVRIEPFSFFKYVAQWQVSNHGQK
ncbi:ABC transporter substrate-binding protein [Pseudobacteriovorax antillogorgiicola]|uniref:ABC-type transport system, substrate-binding protein n=1 Tax=Pseudobacteriovorax antillogorgiicola TaxID=1513793 RepID=A0A1Y6CIP5_9BACT|nr:ABC transporter substrate-binding protein [Pseudobacteriovorax antillogorgiicola]TCS46725.1 ABC-type transport system substrate-binding protein [Pseudobacteriovorax antillogorgiicola]SMF67144.1 ABC-type transport system, substrate-binding protein [Pseudobacteriovorax antillogorgiicola]